MKPSKFHKIPFVKASSRVNTTKRTHTGILHLASDWILLVDLVTPLIFPPHIAITELRPDVVLYSNSLKRVILVELTSPCEENMEYWHDYKVNHYSPLARLVRSNGWSCDVFPIEVGARGYCSRSVLSTLRRLGFSNKISNKCVKDLGLISSKSSFVIWLARTSKEWSPDLDCTIPSFKKGKFKQPPSKNF